jgi:hypothetical protein
MLQMLKNLCFRLFHRRSSFEFSDEPFARYGTYDEHIYFFRNYSGETDRIVFAYAAPRGEVLVRWSKFEGWVAFDLGPLQDERNSVIAQSRIQTTRPGKVHRHEIEEFIAALQVSQNHRDVVLQKLTAAGF